MGQIVKTAGRERDRVIENKKGVGSRVERRCAFNVRSSLLFLTFKDYSSVWDYFSSASSASFIGP